MEEDASSTGWAQRAACRWVTYALLWTLAVSVGIFSAYHPILGVAAGVLGCLLALSLPFLFITLFEVTYSRRFRRDLPILCFPWLGAVVVVLGMIALLEASSFITATTSTLTVSSAKTFMDRFAEREGQSLRRKDMPLTVCIQNAFVKTDWEAGKLRCRDNNGHVECVPAFVAAPIFDDKSLADAGKPDDIHGWAVSRGRHVDVNYEPDGRLCGYLHGRLELDFHISDYRLAVLRIINNHNLHLTKIVKQTEEAQVAQGMAIPGERDPLGLPDVDDMRDKLYGQEKLQTLELEARPLFLTLSPQEVTHTEQVFLIVAGVLLCLCPCAGPLPVAAVLIFVCWASGDRHAARHVLSQDDVDDYDLGHLDGYT
mmetsp:Transcript_145890/g.254513  ORF Transcript_145890/g.254513 Transcript_145890/m.254513 type:complete len:370 (+) Transcript_145890:152-1261(+)